MKIDNETVKPVPGYPNYYVSDKGNVFSSKKQITNNVTWRKLSSFPNVDGYPTVNLYKNGKPKVFRVHQLVLLAFVGACPKGKEVGHKDGTRTNNNLSNLRYVTQKENASDREKHGNTCKGSRNGWALLNEWQVRIIRRVFDNNYKSGSEFRITAPTISKIFGVSPVAIYKILNGTNWANLKQKGITFPILPESSIKCSSSRFSKNDILKIYAMKDSDLSQKSVGKKFGLSQSAVGKIWNGSNWSHVTGASKIE